MGKFFDWFYKTRHRDSIGGIICGSIYYIFSLSCVAGVFMGLRWLIVRDGGSFVSRVLGVIIGILGALFVGCLILSYSSEDDQKEIDSLQSDLKKLMCEYIRYKDIAEHEKGKFNYPNGKEPRWISIVPSDYSVDYYGLEIEVRKDLYR